MGMFTMKPIEEYDVIELINNGRFEGDLYGKHICLAFHKFLRPEQKFSSLEELKQQIQRDAAQTRSIL